MGSDTHFHVSPEILIGFKLSLWLGHSRTFRVICKPLLLCLGSLSCWKVIFLPCLGFWMLWTRFLLWHYIISMFWSIELYFWSDESLSPCRWQTAPQHCYKHTLIWDGTLNEAECFFSELFPRCVASRKPVSDAVSSDLRAWFLLWNALSAIKPFIKMCVPFQITPIQLNLPSVNIYQQHECSWARFQLSGIRVCILMQWNHLSFYV